MVRIRLNAGSIIGIINALILAYAAWVKLETSNCYFCNQTTYLPISDLTLAYLGIAMSLFLAALAYAAKVNKKFGLLALALSAASAVVSSYLVAAQVISRHICYLCLVGDIGFYLLFVAILHITVLKPFWYLVDIGCSRTK
ncbi:MAG: hypothetical protein PHT62_07350 [Desulfotomaculaceae bacterium]|nr:hypothetical protein [Desulfotomaculaceae bacterium]